MVWLATYVCCANIFCWATFVFLGHHDLLGHLGQLYQINLISNSIALQKYIFNNILQAFQSWFVYFVFWSERDYECSYGENWLWWWPASLLVYFMYLVYLCICVLCVWFVFRDKDWAYGENRLWWWPATLLEPPLAPGIYVFVYLFTFVFACLCISGEW